MLTAIQTFGGVDRFPDAKNRKVTPLEYAEGVVLRPSGGFSRAPEYERLWGLVSLGDLKSALGVSRADHTCCVKLVNEGETCLVFYDFANDMGLGVFYAGKDVEFEGRLDGGPTLTAVDSVHQVLWRGLSPRVKWNGTLISGRLYLGNGVDANLVYDADLNCLSVMGVGVAPLPPTLALVGMVNQVSAPSFLEAGGLRFEAGLRRAHVLVTVRGGTGIGFSSSVAGKGTFCDPLNYVVTCPAPLSTNQQLAWFIERDPNASGVVTCAHVSSSEEQAPLFPSSAIGGGTDEVPPRHSGVETDEFEKVYNAYVRMGVRVLLTYIKKDERLGIVESAPSSDARIETSRVGSRAHAVQVNIEKDGLSPDADGWTGIRVYAAEICLDCTCDRRTKLLRLFELPNESQRVTVYPWHVNERARTDLAREGRLVEEKNLLAARSPAPSRAFVCAGNRIYMAGNWERPLRVSFTQERTSEQVLTETTGEELYEDLTPQGSGSEGITALAEFRGGVLAFAGRMAYESKAKAEHAVLCGPVNSWTGVNWTNGSYYYLGKDFNLYRISASPQAATSAPLDALVSEKISGYIREYADINDSVAPHGAADFVNRLWWIWTRAKFGGMAGFAFDFERGELTGPFYLPSFISVTSVSAADGRLVGLTLRGELFVWDLRKLARPFGSFANTAGVTTVDSNSASIEAAEQQGFGAIFLKNNKSVLKGNVLRLRTGWLDFGEPETEKGFYEFYWSVVKCSSGLVCLRLETSGGAAKDVYYGEVFGKERHKVLTMLSGAALRAHFTVWVEQGKDFAVRNWAVGWKRQGRG
ncbi:MAG: hypothetical protein V1746_06530 [bacterium]